MLPYLIVVIIPLLVEVLYNRRVKNGMLNSKKSRWGYIFLSALPMFFLIAFRNQTLGNDTNGYLENFIDTINISWSELEDSSRMEFGYLIFVKLLTYITHNPLIFQIIYTSIYILSLTSFINELDENHFLVLFLFGTMGMYMFMFTGVRQCLAMCICFLSFRFIKKRKIIPFALLMFLAFFFHKSSVLFVVAYFIYPRKLESWNILIYIVIGAVALIYLDVIQQWFNDKLDYEYGIEGNTGGIIYSLIIIVITIFTIILNVRNKALAQKYQGLINIGIISTFFWVLRIATRIAERPSYYFLLFLFASLTGAINSFNNSKQRDFAKIVVVMFALSFYIYKFLTSFVNFVPYLFYSV